MLTLNVALPNYAALGLPILGSVVGENPATLLSVVVSIACGSVLLTLLCLLILEREKARAARRKPLCDETDCAGRGVISAGY